MANTDTDDGKRQLSELRECFIELKARLDRNIKENQETMRNIANLNYYIESLLVKAKEHFGPKLFPNTILQRRHAHYRAKITSQNGKPL